MSSGHRSSSTYIQSPNTKLGIVTQLPLRCLWGESGKVNAIRLRELSSADVTSLLRESEVQFVVADLGLKPRWIELQDCYRFWLDEVKHHITDAAKASHPAAGVYGYKASEWHGEQVGAPIVVLEVCH